MMPGLFDLPAPLLQWLDERLTTVVPPPFSVAIWAALAGILCLELYRVVSPQAKIGRIRREAKEAQRELADYDGELEGAGSLIRKMLSLSLQRVGIVLPATLVSAYPVIVLLVWLSNSYGHRFPGEEEAVSVDTRPAQEARWVNGSEREPPRVETLQRDGNVALVFPVPVPVPVLHKHLWWNWLLANPAGYLPEDAPVEEIRLHLPARELLPAGPTWMRGWEAVFIPVLFVVALAYKTARKID